MAAETQAQPFRITVLEGPTANTDAGDFDLLGRALPYRAVAWETEQRGTTTYYPGNPVGTQQLMGPVDKALTITGMWKDIFLGNGTARRLCDRFDALNRAGLRVRLSWGASEFGVGPLVRTGYLKTFKQTYDRPQDVTWEMTFELNGRDDSAVSALTQAPVITARDGFDHTRVQFGNVADVNDAWQESFITQLMGLPQQVEAALDAVQTTMANGIIWLETATDTIGENSEIPGNIISRARSVAIEGAAAIRHSSDVFTGLDLQQILRGNSALGWLDYLNMIYRILQTNDTAAEAAVNLDAAMAKQQKPTILDEIQVQPGTDLRDIATKYYGNPDLWYLIANENGLDGSKMPTLPTGPSDMPVNAVSGGVSSATLRIPQQTAGVMGVSRPEC
jgi:hypothetical protein